MAETNRDAPLASALRARRAADDIDQGAAAERFSVHRNTYGTWESGTRPPARLLPALAVWLDVDGNTLLSWLGEA